jgi:hypothetical protein
MDKAVTIMDGPYPSLYPWDEENGICSLTSAKWTPIAKIYHTSKGVGSPTRDRSFLGWASTRLYDRSNALLLSRHTKIRILITG